MVLLMIRMVMARRRIIDEEENACRERIRIDTPHGFAQF